jgi:hypothetical protein
MSEINLYDEELDSDYVDTFESMNSPIAQDSSSTDPITESCTWDFRSKLSPRESEKEYFIFKFWLDAGSGRSKQYTAKVYNLSEASVIKLSTKNNWVQRALDFDRHQLQIMQAAENTRRSQEHKRKLEEYRMQQEFIGRSLSSDAAKLAAIVSNTLDKFMLTDREIDIRDLPAVLNAANKAAEVGRNLQSSSLGVDQLLTALEESDD